MKFLFTLFLAILFHVSNSQTPDSISARVDSLNKIKQAQAQNLIEQKFSSDFISTEGKTERNDIQQVHLKRRNGIVFLVLVVLLAILTYTRTFFSKDLEDMLKSFVNKNIAQQIFRTQTGELTFSDFLLHLNFILVFSLYTRFVAVNFFHATSLESFSSVLFLIFLFTFFYVGKIFSMQFIGFIFETKNVCEEYIFYFTTTCKTLGLTLIPALFVLYAAPDKYFAIIFFITLFIVAIFVFIFVLRALSTSVPLLYNSVYHFFIYVCCVEISPIFLLFKLLTKTIT